MLHNQLKKLFLKIFFEKVAQPSTQMAQQNQQVQQQLQEIQQVQQQQNASQAPVNKDIMGFIWIISTIK